MSYNERVARGIRLCAVTDRHWISQKSAHTLEDQVQAAIEGGATMIQLREKNLDRDEFVALGLRIKKITARSGVPLIVNDSLEVALALGADGLHIGQEDGDAALIRKKIGTAAILGVSVHSVEEAIAAARSGADYIGVGAVFPTGSKDDVSTLTRETVAAICASVSIPAIAIGGIGKDNVKLLAGCALAGIAAISAIFAEPDRVREATAELASAAAPLWEES